MTYLYKVLEKVHMIL